MPPAVQAPQAKSKNRFNFLSSLQFDDLSTIIAEIRKVTSFTLIDEIWNTFQKMCQSQYYKPNAYVTIDRQLVDFRRRYAFRSPYYSRLFREI